MVADFEALNIKSNLLNSSNYLMTEQNKTS